ncbi:MAG: hypothetical protein J5817_10825, partial [Treponema sp.]|nr:hypothetical protein [Treponema sp.]
MQKIKEDFLMIKKLFVLEKYIFLIASLMLLTSCKNKAEIIFWDYSEDLAKEEVNADSNVNELKSKYA